MFYNQYIGNETIEREYKELTLKHPFDNDESEELIELSKWVFNNLIKSNIHKYFQKYLAKYTVGFMDILSETETGELYIGVNDAGIVEGIPFQGILTKDDFMNEIKKIINEKIICSDKQKEIILNSITLDILPVEYIHEELLINQELLSKYHIYKANYNLKEQKYAKEYLEWYNQLNIYTTKLIDLFNWEPTRFEIYQYIKKIQPESHVLKMMDDGFLIEQKNYDEIAILKDDIGTPYYWVCEWKDFMICSLKQFKPVAKHRTDVVHFLDPIHIINKLNCMIPSWIKNNENMNLFLIKITFKKHQDINEIYYLDTFNKINRCYRTVINDIPCCMSV